MTSTVQKGGAVLLVHWGSEVRSYIYSGFVEKLARHMPVTVVSRIVDGEFAHHLAEGVSVVSLPEFPIDPWFARCHALGNKAHGEWRLSQGEFVSDEYYAIQLRPKSPLAKVKTKVAPLLANRASIQAIDFTQRQLGKKALRKARAARALLEELEPKVILAADYLSPSSNVIFLVAQDMGAKTIGLPQNWNNIYKCARIFWDTDRQIVWSENMRQFLLERNLRLRPENVVAAGSPQFDFHCDKTLIMPREEFAQMIGFDPSRPLICYSAAAPRTVLNEARILRGFLEAIEAKHLYGKPQVVVRLNPIGSDPAFTDLAREYLDCYLCEPGWEVRRDISWICSSLNDVKIWMNLIFHSAVNISVPSTVTLDFAGMDRPVVNIGYDPPGTDTPAVSLVNLWEQDIYRPIVELGAAKIALTQAELTEFVDSYLRHPSDGRAERQKLTEMSFAGYFGKSSHRIVSEVLDLLRLEGQPMAEREGGTSDDRL